jgi:hypothetical protein
MKILEFVDRPRGRGFRGKIRPAGGDRQRAEHYALAKLQSEAVRKNPGGLVFLPS